MQQLDEMTLQSSSSPNSAIIIIDASVKNDIAISISHIYILNHPLIKMVHHAAYVTSTEAELFAIRCGINQACSKNNISKIIVIIRIPNHLILNLCFLVVFHGIIARRSTMITSSVIGK